MTINRAVRYMTHNFSDKTFYVSSMIEINVQYCSAEETRQVEPIAAFFQTQKGSNHFHKTSFKYVFKTT